MLSAARLWPADPCVFLTASVAVPLKDPKSTRARRSAAACPKPPVHQAGGRWSGPNEPAEPHAPPQPRGSVYTDGPEGFQEHKAVVEAMAYSTTSYPALASWLQANQQEIIQNPNLAVLAMLRAVDLMDTLSPKQMDSLQDEQILEAVAAQERVGEVLLPALRQALPHLPLDALSSMAQAASLLGDSGYEESFFFGLEQALQRAAAGGVRVENQAGVLPCSAEVQGTNLVVLVGALARAGYYSPETMDLLAREAAGAVGGMEPGMLASLVEGYMELQHLDQQLLTSVGRQLLQQQTPVQQEQQRQQQQPALGTGLVLGALTALQALQVALAFAFFNVQNPSFYQVLLVRAASVMQQRQQLQHAEQAAGEVELEEWRQEVLKLHMACMLAPGGNAAVPASARALLEEEACRHVQECKELAAEQASLVWDEEDGQTSGLLLEFRGLDLLATRQVTAVLALGGTLGTLMTQADQGGNQRQQQMLQQPELPMPCSVVDDQAPWLSVDVALAGHDRVGVVVLPQECYCRNMVRLRGTMQAQLRCMQALGWAIWPVSVEDWGAAVEEAAARAGIEGGYEGASRCLGRWIAFVARREKAQILKRLREALMGSAEDEGDEEVLGLLQGELGSSTDRMGGLFESFLAELSPSEQTSMTAFLAQLQTYVWEGLEGAQQKRQNM